MRKILRSLLAAGALSLAAAGSALAVPVNQLGFILDASGSVAPADYDLLRTGLNSALAGLPTDGTVEITVVSYSGGAQTVVAPTVLDATTLAGIQAAISNHPKFGGSTNTGGAIAATTTLMTGSANFADPGTTSAINLATDGFANDQTFAENAAADAAAAGIDSLSVEAIGGGINNTGGLQNMQALAFPGPVTILALDSTDIPNPNGGSWVVPLSNFNTYAGVVNAKVQAIVNPGGGGNPVPEPALLALFAIGLGGMAVGNRRRRKSV